MPPYNYEIDPTEPTDANFVSEGDDELRNLKAALLERLDLLLVDRTVDPEEWLIDPRLLPAGSFLVVSASEDRFAPVGTETNATRVANAISYAASAESDSKVVYVPRSMWGYSTNPGFSTSMFVSSVLLVREGSLMPWYDPVAYGADLTGDTNNRSLINVAVQHAKISEGPGIRVLALTVPGLYRKDTDVDISDIGFVRMPDAEDEGAGKWGGFPLWIFPGAAGGLTRVTDDSLEVEINTNVQNFTHLIEIPMGSFLVGVSIRAEMFQAMALGIGSAPEPTMIANLPGDGQVFADIRNVSIGPDAMMAPPTVQIQFTLQAPTAPAPFMFNPIFDVIYHRLVGE